MIFLQALESDILLWIQENLRTEWLSAFFLPLTRLGNYGHIWLGVLWFFTFYRHQRYRRAVYTGLASLLSTFLLVDMVIKPFFQRIRPYEAIHGLSLLVKKESSFSFPSGHAATAFAVAYVLFRRLPKAYGIPALILAFLMAFSRVYVGVHYPTDVLVGSLVGCVMGELMIFIEQKIVEYKR